MRNATLRLLTFGLLVSAACSSSDGQGTTSAKPDASALGGSAGSTSASGNMSASGGDSSSSSRPRAGGASSVAAGSQAGGETGAGGKTTSTGGRSTADAGVDQRADGATGGATGTAGTSALGTSSGGARRDAGADLRAGSGGAGDASTSSGSASGGSRTDGGTPTCTLPAASTFQVNTSVGGGGTSYKESDHFVVFNSSAGDTVLNLLESAHQCFVEEWCWRSTGLSITSSSGTTYKTNAYSVASLANNAAGVMQYDSRAGLAYLEVVNQHMTSPSVTVHEYGHALTLAAKSWVEQTRTGFWWESVANFVADTFMTSEICAEARARHNIATGNTLIDLNTVIGNSFWTICMNQNYYQAWPFFTYLTSNPDGFAGLGKQALPDLWRTYKGNNETPLHTLERLIAPLTVQDLVGRYWARMAYVDIGHPQGQKAFNSAKSRLNFANLTASGTTGTYKVITARQPRYFGANIVPLKVSATEVSAQVDLVSSAASSGLTATFSIRNGSGAVRYVDLPDGKGSATLTSGEEITLVVANTPKALILFDPATIGATASSDPANVGLDYQVRLTGATPAF